MITEIGIIAGEIWHYLDDHGVSPLSSIVSESDRKKDLILMSLGWLAREGHVVVNCQSDDYVVSLRKERSQI